MDKKSAAELKELAQLLEKLAESDYETIERFLVEVEELRDQHNDHANR